MRTDKTADQSSPRRSASMLPGRPIPGLVHIYATDLPTFVVREVDTPIAIGRGDDCDIVLDDRRASRRHAEVRLDAEGWQITDLGSHNGTFVDAVRIDGSIRIERNAVLAVGNSVFLLVDDVRPLRGGVTVDQGITRGPRLAATWNTVAAYATSTNALHVLGETGTGKELIARHFHASRSPNAPFVAINCAAIPPLLAERLFFGARRGTYSGAEADTDGYLVAAEGGVLFLDEIGELSLDVQAKLLRAIESHEVLPLGAAKTRSIELAIVTATHVDLRAAVSDGRFREDLYFRIVNPTVTIAPLRDRREEIPWLIGAALDGSRVRAHASFVEAALVRPWPGNTRELLRAVSSAARLVPELETHLKMMHLADQAGLSLGRPTAPEDDEATPDPESAAICDALRAHDGNVTRAAQALGLHRNQLRRWLKRNRVDPHQFKSGLLVADSSD